MVAEIVVDIVEHVVVVGHIEVEAVRIEVVVVDHTEMVVGHIEVVVGHTEVVVVRIGVVGIVVDRVVDRGHTAVAVELVVVEVQVVNYGMRVGPSR